MKQKFNVFSRNRTAVPRSQRRNNVSGSIISAPSAVLPPSNSGGIADGHTHPNLSLLNSLSLDSDDYLLTQKRNPDLTSNPSAEPMINAKIKAGYSDDSHTWDEHVWDDYMNQALRTTDTPVFAGLRIKDFLFSQWENAKEKMLKITSSGVDNVIMRFFHLKVNKIDADTDVVVGKEVRSDDYAEGNFAGSGFKIGKDSSGDSIAEVDKLVVRKEALFNEVIINQVSFRLGETVFSNGGFECTEVEDISGVYRCFYDNKDGRRYCGLVVGDQVRCQRYDANQKNIIKYYWRLVEAVGENYVDLSKTDFDGNGIPEEGDNIVQFGNRTELSRQSAIIINPLSGGSVEVYAHINSYSLLDRNYVGMGVNAQTGEAYTYGYGDMFFGDRDNSVPDANFIAYQKRAGDVHRNLYIQGRLTVGAGSSGLENLVEWVEKQTQINEAQATAHSADRKAQQAKDYIDNTLPGELSEINKRLDGVVENWFYPYTPSLYNEPAQTWIADGEQENHIGDTFTNTLPANFDPTDAGCWEQGSIGASYIDGIKTWDQIKIADSTRIRLKTPVGGIPKGAVLSVGEGYTMGYNPIASSGAVIASYVWSQSYTVGSDNPYIAFVIRKTDNAKITPAEYPQIHFTISSDKTTNPDAGKSWRWVKEEDGTYKWTPIADSDAVKALQEAARAQDTADAKRRVFVVTPTTPYDVGDIWTQGEGGDIMRCIESRATGNFESSDWDKASKYTDDTAANEAKERLAAMSSDGTLSKEEKPAVRQQWSQIQKEYAKYQTDATSFGVSITALKGAYDALAAYLSSIGLTSDTDTTIVPDTFNQKFADYYAEVSRFSNLVAQKQADEAVDNLQVGARNYIAKQFIREWNSVKEGVTDVVTSGADADGTYLYVNWGKLIQAGLAATNASQVSTVPDCFGGQIKYKPNTPYVFKARIKQGAEITFRIIYEDGTKEVLSAPPAGTEGVYEVVHTIDASRVVQKIYMYVGKGVFMYLYDIQLTEGNKAPTGYITAEEDVQAQIEQVKLDVDYIASDSSLTPSDKQQVANEWVRIQGEYWSIMARADQYGVDMGSFPAYFKRLEDYLAPLLADMSTTSEITGTEFRDVFADYYQLSGNMSDLIDDAIDESIKSTEYLKQAMEDGSTEVKGGLIMTNVMLLKNADGDVTAGVSGLQEDDVPFWSGADYTNRKKAVFRVHADGEVHATKGTVGILQVKNDSVEVSDAAASGDKIILTPYRITSISQVLGAVSVPGVIETKEVSALATGQSNPFVRNVYESSPPFTCGQGVQMSARITARITGNAEGGGGGVKIEVVNALTGKADPLYRNSTAEAQNTNLNIDATISHLFTGAAQKYYIRITVEASASGKLAASATVNAAQFNFVKDIRKNLIAPNGVAVVKGSSNYAVFTGDIFEVLIGKAGLRIQNGYVYKKDTDHTTWTKI